MKINKKSKDVIEKIASFENEDIKFDIVRFLKEKLDINDEVVFERWIEENEEYKTIKGKIKDFIKIEGDFFINENFKEGILVKKDDWFYDVPLLLINVEEKIQEIAANELNQLEYDKIYNPEKIILKEIKNINYNSNVNWGIEIEGGFNNNGYESALDDLNFKTIRDSSVSVDCKHPIEEIVDRGYETTENIKGKVVKIIKHLNNYDFVYDESCGIHIHTSERHNETWNIQNIYKLSYFYCYIEDLLYCFVPDDRERDSKAEKLSTHNSSFFESIRHLPPQMIDRMAEMDVETLKEQLGILWYNRTEFREEIHENYHTSRYTGFNIHAFFNKGTIEFRHFDANYNNLPYFIELIDSIINLVQTKTISSIALYLKQKIKNVDNNKEKIKNFFKLLDLSKETMNFLIERVKDLNPNLLQTSIEQNDIEECFNNNIELIDSDDSDNIPLMQIIGAGNATVGHNLREIEEVIQESTTLDSSENYYRDYVSSILDIQRRQVT